jgi:hypothetical protein
MIEGTRMEGKLKEYYRDGLQYSVFERLTDIDLAFWIYQIRRQCMDRVMEESAM